MGGPIGHKYRYAFTKGQIDCMMVRMVYFLHDVEPDQGVFSVVPGTTSRITTRLMARLGPDDEPGMIGLPVKAGDAILFTEHLRHGGLINKSEQDAQDPPRRLRSAVDDVPEYRDRRRSATTSPSQRESD